MERIHPELSMLQSGHGSRDRRTDGRTDRRTDRRTEWNQYTPQQLRCSGGIIKNTWHTDVVNRQIYNCVRYFCMYLYALSLYGWHAVFCITNNRHNVTITTHAFKRHFLIWMMTLRQPTKRRCSCVLTLSIAFQIIMFTPYIPKAIQI